MASQLPHMMAAARSGSPRGAQRRARATATRASTAAGSNQASSRPNGPTNKRSGEALILKVPTSVVVFWAAARNGSTPCTILSASAPMPRRDQPLYTKTWT